VQAGLLSISVSTELGRVLCNKSVFGVAEAADRCSEQRAALEPSLGNLAARIHAAWGAASPGALDARQTEQSSTPLARCPCEPSTERRRREPHVCRARRGAR
jgi:hypothetical protein